MANEYELRILSEKIELLSQKQALFSQELSELKEQLRKLQSSEITENEIVTDSLSETNPVVINPIEEKITESEQVSTVIPPRIPKGKSSWERFIGENLLSKIGILVMIIGVLIGVKYSIEHELISPVVRIALGYATGVALLVTGIMLKSHYERFSAVLVAGALTMFYFITFFAYDFYGLLPRLLAFVLMLVFTVFAVVAALNYRQQIIATLGLVGSYALPFVLSDSSGNVATLFAYLAIINIGMAVISVFREWRSVRFLSYFFTWIIFFSMFLMKYEDTDFYTYFIFATVSFLTFYFSSIAHRIKTQTDVSFSSSLVILSNSLAYYIACVQLFDFFERSEEVYPIIALVTLANALFHFGISVWLHRFQSGLSGLKYVVLVLAISFATLAVPIQFKGVLITLFWITEAALLFWIGRSKNISFFTKISYFVVFISFISLIWDWTTSQVITFYPYNEGFSQVIPFTHSVFFTALFFLAGLGFIVWYYFHKPDANGNSSFIINILSAILLFSIFYTFYFEIAVFWDIRHNIIIYNTELSPSSVLAKRQISLDTYSILFASALTLVNIRWIKSRIIGYTSLIFNSIMILLFLFSTLHTISQLRNIYLSENLTGDFYFAFRYVAIALFATLLYATYRLLRSDIISLKWQWATVLALHFCILWVASSELFHWTEMWYKQSDYKLGLSILWAIYALIMIVLGLYYRQKFLRIGAIVLFAVTLIKLFTYDIVHLGTLYKTAVFLAIGAILLLTSFLYNKYNKRIDDGTSEEN